MSDKNLVGTPDTQGFVEAARVDAKSAQQRPQHMQQRPQQMQQPRLRQRRMQLVS